MAFTTIVVPVVTLITILLQIHLCLSAEISRADFPHGFTFGTASSAFQYEGAVKEDGRGPSIWDTFSHTFGKVTDFSNADVAVDHYHRYQEDIQLMKDLGMDAYRFSISWSRIFPNGSGAINQAGIDHYNKFINALLAKGIEPYVTLYHWDIPQALDNKYKGWLSTEIIKDFATYAETCFQKFGDRVKHWITFNEPHTFTTQGYDVGLQAPGRKTTLNHEFPSLPTSLLSFNSLITSLPPSQKPNLVLEWLLEKLLKQNVKDHSFFSDLISLCGKVKNVKLGMHVFSSMEAIGVKPTSLVFNSLINLCLFSDDIVTAYSLFEIMESSERFKPDFRTYDNFVSAFFELGNVDAMLGWYLAKKAAGFGSDVRVFELVLTGCVDGKKFEIADRVFEEMVVLKIIPNGTILESMVKGLCEQKSLCRAEEFVKFVLDNEWEISETMVEMLIGLYHEQERVEKMEELLETVTKYLVDSGVLSRIHRGIVRTNAVLDRFDDVELSVSRMLKQGMSFANSDDVEKVICSYFRKEAYDRLDIFLECIKNSYVLTRSTFELLISGYRRANLHEKVDLVLVDMKSMGLA